MRRCGDKIGRGRTVVVLRERDDALDLGRALEDGYGLLRRVGDDERPGGGGAPRAGDEVGRVERACGGIGSGEERSGRGGGGGCEEEGLRGHGGLAGGGGLWDFGRVLGGVGGWR